MKQKFQCCKEATILQEKLDTTWEAIKAATSNNTTRKAKYYNESYSTLMNATNIAAKNSTTGAINNNACINPYVTPDVTKYYSINSTTIL